MKKSTKILVLALSLALLVGVAVGFSASAETAAPEIVSKNVKVDGNYSLMLAVDPATVAGDDVTITIYAEAPAEGVQPVQTITKAKTATEKINLDGEGEAEFDAIVFETYGVSAKDIADVWYITTTSAGVTSDPITYSVREYAFERLYKNGTVFASSTDADKYKYYQKQFYLELLDVGSAAQQLLVNKALIAEGKAPETLAKDYTYVYVANGTYTAGNVTAGLGFVDKNASLALSANAGAVADSWNIYTFDKNGVLISEKAITAGEALTVAGNSVVFPYDMGVTPGKYFDEVGNSKYNFTGATWKYMGEYTAHTKFSTSTVGTYSFTDSGDEDHGAALRYTKIVSSSPFAHFPVAVAEENANCIVFEADIKLVSGYAAYTADEQKTGIWNAFIIGWNKATLANTNAFADMNIANPGSAQNIYTHLNLYDNDGEYDENGNGGDAIREQHDTVGANDIQKKEWHNVCYEVYTDAKVIKFYVDGNFVCEWSVNIDVTATDINTVSWAFQWRFAEVEFWFDNVYSAKIAKPYSAS